MDFKYFAPDESKNNQLAGLDFSISHTWNGNPVDHQPIDVSLKWHFEMIKGRPHKRVIKVSFKAPLYDDPEPDVPPGITPELWNYEVVEFFFANERNQYLEVEIGPHGHWLCLMFDGVRKLFNNGEELELSISNKFIGDMWHCEFELPFAYLPGAFSKFNCFSIHGLGDERIYEALYPVTDGTYEDPDFHRLEFYKRVNVRRLIPEGYGQQSFRDFKYGDLWSGSGVSS